ncbi:MAG: hypothetical protein U9R53_06325 [Chloroflexota bacterium]|nr:hypothetical protein [Chloroflexota bacterium]
MKKKFAILIIFILLTAVLAACKATQTPVEVKSPPETNDAYPIPETDQVDQAYPVEQFVPLLEAAYPITEEDLQQLIRTWSLTNYSENDVNQAAPAKTIRFCTDGSYELTTGSETISGIWTTRLNSIESILILDPDSDHALTFDILDLNDSHLHLRSLQEGIQIDEEYQPAN